MPRDMMDIFSRQQAAGGASSWSTPNKAAFGIGSAAEVGSDILSGIDENKIASRISGQYEQQARDVRFAGANKINSEDYETGQLLARNRATIGASGIASGGSSGQVMKATATEQTLKDAYTRYSTNLEANALDYAAANARYQGKIGEYSSFVGAGTTALTSALLIGA